jgi:hypothetical protein
MMKVPPVEELLASTISSREDANDNDDDDNDKAGGMVPFNRL